MAGFLYFVPAGDNPPPTFGVEHAKAAGLGYALGDGGALSMFVAKGPDGQPGNLVTFDASAAPRFKPDQQTWVKTKGGPWVGVFNDKKPIPAELLRKRQIAGKAVTLRDGNAWTVPIARSTVGKETLPQRMTLGADGETWTTASLPEFTALCREAETAWDWLYELATGGSTGGGEEADREVTLTLQQAMGVVVAALEVNYRVGPHEIDLLALVGSEEAGEVIRAVCDWQSFVDMANERQKKSRSVASSTDAGPTA